MKKFIITCSALFFLVIGLSIYYVENIAHEKYVYWTLNNQSIKMNAFTKEKKIYTIDRNGAEVQTFFKGVNIGLAMPMHYPGEVKASKSDYLKWFKQIGEMGANTIRVYTLQSPDFYDALFDYNMTSDPLYLVQGAYMNENIIEKSSSALEAEVVDDFKREIEEVIHATHGNIDIPTRVGHAYGKYTSDVSRYVTLYILGIEFEGDFIEKTNNKEKVGQFEGNYLYTENATPFEYFLAKMGEYAIDIETKQYQKQTMISFSNWPTSDPFTHSNEPEIKNNMQGFNQNKIIAKEHYKAGLVASYHVYPYYPDFLFYEDQSQYLDTPSTNAYQDYLKRLTDFHDVPVIVAEYGVPTSRGKTHDDLNRGFNQGGLTEKQQGTMNMVLYNDIIDAEMQGAFIFSWQDEWFKRTWNTMELTNPTGRAAWHDVQTSETTFGLMRFDPELEHVSESSLFQEELQVNVDYDAEYLWLTLVGNQVHENQKLNIYFDITPNSGFNKLDDKTLDTNYDFMINFQDLKQASLLVDPYYDAFRMLFKTQMNYADIVKKEELNYTDLNVSRLRLRNKISIDGGKTVIAPSYYDTGILLRGVLDKNDDAYSNLNDFEVIDNTLKIRIPWQMLNFSDPSNGLVLTDFNDSNFKVKDGDFLGDIEIDEMQIGIEINNNLESLTVKAPKWTTVKCTETLKKSYTIIQEGWTEK